MTSSIEIGTAGTRPSVTAGTRLLGRDAELAAIDALLETGAEGDGGALLIVGHPGLGKTSLCDVATDRARDRGLLVLRAVASELEQSMAFGVAGELLRRLLAAVSAGERAALLAGAPESLRALHRHGHAPEPDGTDDGLALAHGLFRMLAVAADSRPALLAIEDLHWCDAVSLQFVLYLLHRLAELPVALLLTSRPRGTDDAAMGSIAAHPAIVVHALAPLGPDAAGEMISRALGSEPSETLTAACMEATAGNPFYLRELGLALADHRSGSQAELERHARALVPDAVTRAVRARIAGIGADAIALASSVAILGGDAPVRTAAALAELDVTRAAAAADALASVEVLLPKEPLSFVHALVAAAVEQDIPASRRAGRHLDAARLLGDDGADVELVAAHLLRGRAEGDAWAVEQLRAAALQARSRGAVSTTVTYLERALAEPPSAQLRAELLADLGSAEARLGLQGADDHLALAVKGTNDPRRLAEIALVRGGALFASDQAPAAVEAFRAGLRELERMVLDERGLELRDRLQAGLLLSSVKVPGLQADAVRASAEVLERDPGPTASPSRRLLLAQATVAAAFGGRPAQEVIDLATRAWDDGRLLGDDTAAGASWVLVTGALCLAGDLERSLAGAEAAATDARERSAPLAFATASFMRALPQLWRGEIDGALADLELARDARRFGWRQYARSATAQYCLCLVQKGELDRAASALTEDQVAAPHDAEDAVYLYALAELRRAQGYLEEAYATALAAGEIAEGTIQHLGYCPWRSSAAQSALSLGMRDRALELARYELYRSQATHVLHERIRALRLAGLCEGGDAGLEKLREAVSVALAAEDRPRLETVHALISLGSGLRRGGNPTAAREPLQRAFELARRGGATALLQSARDELAATGARLRRDALSGPGSLTPSERRVADLAALGRGNREIARALFVTPKTVEYHLRNAYRKLQIENRRELAQALSA